jgi:Zn-dependent peptidase ImmA (M78 family)
MTQQPTTNVLKTLRELTPPRRLTIAEAKSIAERQAAKLLALFSIGEPPVDVSLVAELPRIEVTVRANRGMGGLSGLSEWNKGRWLIAVNQNDSHTRRRFTLAHEFKHILDNPFIRVLYTDKYGRTDEQSAEEICDYFAACLLMPRPWVKYAWTNVSQETDELAGYFRVSPAAMARRLSDLGLSRPHPRHQASQSITRYFRRAPIKASVAAA